MGVANKDKAVIVFYYYTVLWCVPNNRVHYDLKVVFVCLHTKLPYYYHYTDLTESIEFRNCLLGTLCIKCVFKIKSIHSLIVHAIYEAAHIQLTHFSYNDCENTCTLSYYHHQIGSTPQFVGQCVDWPTKGTYLKYQSELGNGEI